MSTCTALIPVQQFTSQQLLDDPPQLLLELFQTRQQANYWKAQFQRSKEREAKLQQQIRELQAESQTTETSALRQEVGEEKPFRDILVLRRRQWKTPSRPATRQSPRRSGEAHERSAHHRRSPRSARRPKAMSPAAACPIESFPGTEDSETIEIDVRAHRRVIRRKAIPTGMPMSRQLPASSPRQRAAQTHPQGTLWHLRLDPGAAGQVPLLSPQPPVDR